MKKMGKVFFSCFFAGIAAGGGAFGFSLTSDSETEYQALEPVNLEQLDFPVPWGLRYGRPARMYFGFRVGAEGFPEDIETLRTIPHHDYKGIAKTTLKKFKYPVQEVGTKSFAELDYCVMTDSQSTFACTVRFERLGADPAMTAKLPGDSGFYRIDRYAGFPRVKNSILPNYPWLAAQKSQCGWVKASLEIGKGGYPKNIQILETSDSGVFSLVVKDALKNFTFEKGEATTITYLVSFEIPGKCAL